MNNLQIFLSNSGNCLQTWFGGNGAPNILQVYTRASAIFLAVILFAGIATCVLKKGSLTDSLAWFTAGCILSMAIIGEAPFWITLAFTAVLLASYWLLRYSGVQSDSPANRQH